MNVTVSRSFGGRRRHLAVTFKRSTQASPTSGWVLQWAVPTESGHRYDMPLDEGPFRTKREATLRKREILAGQEGA